MYDAESVRRGFQAKATLLSIIHRTGCTAAGRPVWTEQEVQQLRRHYPNMAVLKELLCRRTPPAIRHKASALGIAKPRNLWSTGEISIFKRPYKNGTPVHAIEQLLGNRTARQIYTKASDLRVRRPRALKPTGMAVVDQIRSRALSQGYSMTELDEWVGVKRYFLCPRTWNFPAIARAIYLLGGELAPVWKD